MTTKSKTQDKNKLADVDESILKLYDIKKRLGKGAYGIVWKAMDKRTNETLAVKKIFDAFRDETDAQRTFREICFLQSFRSHPNIVRMLNIYKAANNLDIYLVFEFMESDLHNIIKKGTILKDIHKRYIMCQLVNAVRYIHSGNVIHRDLKPSNVLLDSKCRCKLADFGLARSLTNQASRDGNDSNTDLNGPPLLTDYVATRWYRAPEILVASKRYTKGIDMWSLGCILAEMIRGKPLFQGTSTVNQIEKIVSALPDITDRDINSVGAGFGCALLSKPTTEKRTSLEELVPDATSDGLDMIKSLLVLDPLGRLTADQAINHAYVERFRGSVPQLELNKDVMIPFRDDVRLSVAEYRTKLYEMAQATERQNCSTLNTNTQHCPKRHSSSQKRCVPTTMHSQKTRESKYIERSVFDNADMSKKVSKISISSSPTNVVSNTTFIERLDRHCTNSIQPRKLIKQTMLSPSTKERLLEANKAPHRNRVPAAATALAVDFPQRHNNGAAIVSQHQSRGHEKKQYASMSRNRTPSRTNEYNYNLDKRHSIDGGYGSLPADTGSSDKNSSGHQHHTQYLKVSKSSSITKLNTATADPALTLMQQMIDGRQSSTTLLQAEKNRALHRSSSVILAKGHRNMNDIKSTQYREATGSTMHPFCYDTQIKKIEAQLAGFKDEIKRFAKENKYYSRQATPTRSSTVLPSSQKQHVHKSQQQQQHHHHQQQPHQSNTHTRYPQVRSKYTMQSSSVLPNDAPLMSSTSTAPKRLPTASTLAFPALPREKNDVFIYTGGSGDHIPRNYSSPMELSSKPPNDSYKYATKHRHNQSHQPPPRSRVSSKLI